MKLTLQEVKLVYNYLSREWLHYDDQAELRTLVSKMGQYIDIMEIIENDEVSVDTFNDEGQ